MNWNEKFAAEQKEIEYYFNKYFVIRGDHSNSNRKNNNEERQREQVKGEKVNNMTESVTLLKNDPNRSIKGRSIGIAKFQQVHHA